MADPFRVSYLFPMHIVRSMEEQVKHSNIIENSIIDIVIKLPELKYNSK